MFVKKQSNFQLSICLNSSRKIRKFRKKKVKIIIFPKIITSFYVHEIEVWLAIISPDTRWEVATYGDFRDNAT